MVSGSEQISRSSKFSRLIPAEDSDRLQPYNEFKLSHENPDKDSQNF